MIKYFCDLCGEEINDPRQCTIPYIKDRGAVTGSIHDYDVGTSHIYLCKTCAFHFRKKIDEDLQELKASMPLETIYEIHYA